MIWRIYLVWVGNTCGESELDKVFTNIGMIKSTLRQPVENLAGTKKSDHAVIHLKADVKHVSDNKMRKHSYLKYTEEGSKKFGELLMRTDWVAEYEGVEESPTALVKILNDKLGQISAECFEKVTKKIKDSDVPWITEELKKKIKQRKRRFNKDKKPSEVWKKMKRETDRCIANERGKYMEKEKQRLMQEGSHSTPY